MVKTWAIGSLALGAALFGTALYIQTRPLAFTETETTLDDTGVPARLDGSFDAAIVEPEPTPAPSPAGLTASAASSVEVPELVIEGRTRTGIATPKATQPVERPLEPCSSWREVGPAHVVDGVAVDSRRVRQLC